MKPIVFVLAVVAFTLQGFATFAITLSEIQEALQKQSGGIQSIRADFHYTETPSGTTGYEIIQRGTFLLKGKEMIKIDFHFPQPQTTLIRGDLVTTTMPDRPDRVQERLDASASNFLSRSIQNAVRPLSVLPEITLKLEGKAGNMWRMTGTPRKADAPFGQVELYLLGDSLLPARRAVYTTQGRLSQVTDYLYEKVGEKLIPSKVTGLYTEGGGAKLVEVRLENLRINQPISDSEFVIPF